MTNTNPTQAEIDADTAETLARWAAQDAAYAEAEAEVAAEKGLDADSHFWKLHGRVSYYGATIEKRALAKLAA